MNFKDYYQQFLERAYHGTPHNIQGDKFDMGKIGSGEGAQAYGWGLYFAENESVAKHYTTSGENGLYINNISLANRAAFQKLSEEDKPEVELILRDYARGDIGKRELSGLAAQLKGSYAIAYNFIRNAKSVREKLGNVYQVNINADKSHFLNWDKPLLSQSEYVKSRIKKSGLWKYLKDLRSDFSAPMDARTESRKGMSIYSALVHKLNSERAASEYLLSIGIPGIMYKDAFSRVKTRGSHNFVVFDPKFIKVVSKNGQYVLPLEEPSNVNI
jgi:hypothetical protein